MGFTGVLHAALADTTMTASLLDPVILSSICSLVVSSCGLTVLAATRPSEAMDSKYSIHILRLAGIIGTLLQFVALVLSSVPMVMGATTTSDGKMASIMQCSLLLVCWAIDRYLLTAEKLPPLQSCACAIVWFGSTVIEWAGPRPHDNLRLGLAGQIAGCDGGYRSPFLIYVSVWLTSLTFGVLLLILDGANHTDNTDSDGDHSTLTQPRLNVDPYNIPMRALPITYGFAVSMSSLLFATGAATNQMSWVIFGAILVAVAAACAWESFWRFNISLTSWVSVSQCCSALLGLMQGHLVFRDFRWDPSNVHAISAVDKWPGLPIFLFGTTLLIAILLLFLADSSFSLWLRKSVDSQAGGVDYKETLKTPLPVTLLQWLLLPPWVGCLYIGITQPLLETEIMTPEIFWISGKESMQQAQHHIAPGSVHHFKSDQSYLDLISFMYDRHLPCSALGIAYTSVIIPPLQFLAVLVALLRPTCVPMQLVDGIRAWLMDQATDRFTNPMTLMLMVALMNVSSPGGAVFKASVTSGFWYLLGYCIFSVCLAWSLQAGAEGTLAWALDDTRSMQRMESFDSCQSQILVCSDMDETDLDESALQVCSVQEADMYDPIFLTIGLVGAGTLVLASIYFSFTHPFLSYDYRVASVSIASINPTLIDLWRTMVKTNSLLGLFAMLSCIAALIVWLAALMLRILLHRSSLCRPIMFLTLFTERLMRPCILTHIWAMSLGIIYYMVTSRSRMLLEVCASVPEPPVGLIATGIMGCSTLSLLYASKYLMRGRRHAESLGVSLQMLPGGPCVWLVAPLACGAFWVTILVSHGPLQPKAMASIGDVNLELMHLVPMINEELHQRMPESAGDCRALWAHRLQTGQTFYPSTPSDIHKACVGQAPLAQVDKEGHGYGHLKAAATWATGLNTLELVELRLDPPVPINSSFGSERWTLSLRGRFTDLRVWMNVLVDEKPFVNDYMCCSGPFNFAMEAVGNCSRGKGFDRISLHLTHMDPIEFVHSVKYDNHAGDSASYQIDYGRSKMIEVALKEFMSGRGGKLLMRDSDGSTADGLEKVSQILGNIMFLNTGQHCLSQTFNRSLV